MSEGVDLFDALERGLGTESSSKSADTLLSEASALVTANDFAEALQRYQLVLVQETTLEPEIRGTTQHNIATCLHHLGELPAAREFYAQAAATFSDGGSVSSVNQRRIDFVRERIALVDAGRGIQSKDRLDASGRRKSEEDS